MDGIILIILLVAAIAGIQRAYNTGRNHQRRDIEHRCGKANLHCLADTARILRRSRGEVSL